MAPNEYELQERNNNLATGLESTTFDHNESTMNLPSHMAHDEEHGNEFSLPPVDGGKDAWLFLGAAFLMEVLVWGFPFAYGIFQDYYSTHEPFAGSHNIAVIGTCAMGLMYLSSPLVFGTLQAYPHLKRPGILCGLIIMCLSLGLSSLSQNVTHLIVSQGVFYAIGGVFAYAPAIQFMDEWFVNKKGFAFGVMWAGTGLGGVLIPLLLQYLLNRYGFRTALRAWCIILFVASVPLTLFVKPRLPIAQNRTGRKFDLSFVKTKGFMLMQIGNMIQGLGFFIPSIYLPAYARQIGASANLSALPLILFNVASTFGCVCMGHLVDRFHVTTCILVSTLGSTLSVFLLWGFSTTIAPLLAFSLLYGLFAGSFTSTWPGIMMAVKRKHPSLTDPMMVFAMLGAGRGIGNVACGPISEVLVRVGDVGKAGVYGTEYGPLVLFTGVSAALSGISVLGRRLGWV